MSHPAQHIYFILAITIYTVHSQNGCAYFNSYSNFNGQFDDSGLTHDGKTYYVMDRSSQLFCGESVYIFYNQIFNKWYLHTSLISGNSISSYYECNTTTDINNIFSCTNWKYSFDNSDVGVFFTAGNCPHATCAQISLNTNAGACSGSMNYIQPNQFSTNNNAPYLIYNEKHAKWICSNNITANWGCQGISGSYIQTDADIGFKTPFDAGDTVGYNGNPGNVNVQFTCVGDVSLSPTTSEPSMSPTKNPTIPPTKTPSKFPSKSPSKFPTLFPTISPSKNPSIPPTISPTTTAPSQSPTTSEPSISPTNMPSETPTKTPTRNPTETGATLEPSKSPTNVPTKYPTISPTKSPTILPTRSPLGVNQTRYPSKSPTQLPSKSPTGFPTDLSTDSPTKLTTEMPVESGDVKTTQNEDTLSEEEGLFGVSFLKLEYIIIVGVVLVCLLAAMCCCCVILYRNNKDDCDDDDTLKATNEMVHTKQEQRQISTRDDDGDGFEYYE